MLEISIPTITGGVPAEHLQLFEELETKIPVTLNNRMTSSINFGRDLLVADFLQSKNLFLLFIDSDIFPTVFDVIQIMALTNRYGFVAAPYINRQTNNLCVEIDDRKAQPLLEVAEIERIGTGFMCIQRGVLAFLFARGEKYQYGPVSCARIFDNSVGSVIGPEFSYTINPRDTTTRHFLGEDYTLCDTWRRYGGKIYSALNINLKHGDKDSTELMNVFRSYVKQLQDRTHGCTDDVY